MKTLNHALINQYALDIRKYYYNRSNYYLDTNQGFFILRKVNISIEQILFMNDAINYLKSNGFSQVSSIYLTKKNLPYAQNKGQLYVLQEHQEGKEIDFQDMKDIKGVVSLLAAFHKCGLNFETEHRSSESVQMKSISDYVSKRYKETAALKKKVVNLSQKTPFEIMFLKDYRVYETLERKALSYIAPLSEETVLPKNLIHNDYKYHTIKRVDNYYHMAHIDNCTYNVQVLDLSSVLTKIMQKNNWRVDILQQLIEDYEAIRPLSEEERCILKSMLIFPEKYANICYKYLQSKRRNNYSMFEVKWQNMLEYQDAQVTATEFIEKHL
ncbi:MAG: hypothetical protein ATN36_03545 [Epulopiscium sp. Nele67-Bin005]|nr:MAG: hypothetical protein ATN36_03545 [Epulopiscium sp. Nele67-Bin005]